MEKLKVSGSSPAKPLRMSYVDDINHFQTYIIAKWKALDTSDKKQENANNLLHKFTLEFSNESESADFRLNLFEN